jgi:DNA-binding transcriptional ArsR family regulator
VDSSEILDFNRDMLRNARRAADTLKALGHESRLLILCLLAEKGRSVAELEELLTMRQPAVSQQLARLRADRLVNARRDGKAIYYSIASPEVLQIIRTLYELYCANDSKAC